MMEAELFQVFPDLSLLEPSAVSTLRRAGRAVQVPEGTIIFREGGSCESYLLVLSGTVCVQMISDFGREIVLYRVEMGQTCVLTMTSLMAGTDCAAQGMAESDVRAIAIPAASFRELIARSSVFKKFAFSAFSPRISDLLLLIEEVAFGRIDVRLAQLLLERRGRDGCVRAAHQQLSVELGTAREVVSRQLKEFERRSWVAHHRGYVELLDDEALNALSGKSSL